MFFLYHKTTRPTGRVLAKALSFQHFGLTPKGIPDFLVRWGNAMPIAVRPGREINTAAAIMRSSNKISALRAMEGANVSVPWFSTSQAEAQARLDANRSLVLFGRTKHGSKGRGITVYKHGDHLGQHDFFSEFVPNDREYRLHVVGDKVIRTQRKYLENEGANTSEFIKNVGQGYVFKSPRKQLRSDREETAINAVKAVGLDFGAVDMVIDYDDVAYVLEINTAPSCSPMTGQAYVTALAALISERSNGDYSPPINPRELEALRQAGEAVDPRARILAYA